MTIKNQLQTLKDNWMLVLLILAIVAVPLFGNDIIYSLGQEVGSYAPSYPQEDGLTYQKEYALGTRMAPSPSVDSFAAGVVDRKITTSSSLSAEVDRGYFADAETRLKSIVTSTNSYLLSESVSRYGEGRLSYLSGYYTIKVETKKYSAVVEQLKTIGEVTAFSENKDDITEQYVNLEIELGTEKQRLLRYQQMYTEATTITDKIELNDRIFEQERKVKYLEDALRNTDQRVDYSTITLSLNEEQSSYANIVWVKLGDLVRMLVESVNSLLALFFVALPYVIVIIVGWLVVKFFKKKRK